MKGIARTQKEIEFHDRVAALGCISCRQEGIFNTHVSIHHAHGRTKPGCHMWVLPLCGPHHQDDGTALARHPFKRRWEAKYGNEDELIRQMWTELGVEFTEPVRVSKPVDRNLPKKPTSAAVEIGVVKLRDISVSIDEPNEAMDSIETAKERPESHKKLKAKFKGIGFPKAGQSFNSKNSKNSRVTKKPLTEKQVAYLAERKAEQKKNRPVVSEELREKAKQERRIFREKYLEKNKDKLEAKKKEAKARNKKFREELKTAVR